MMDYEAIPEYEVRCQQALVAVVEAYNQHGAAALRLFDNRTAMLAYWADWNNHPEIFPLSCEITTAITDEAKRRKYDHRGSNQNP